MRVLPLPLKLTKSWPKDRYPGQHASSAYAVVALPTNPAKQSPPPLLPIRETVKINERSHRSEGLAGENLLQFLERRVDNVVYRAGSLR